jgi:hypothetical protein
LEPFLVATNSGFFRTTTAYLCRATLSTVVVALPEALAFFLVEAVIWNQRRRRFAKELLGRLVGIFPLIVVVSLVSLVLVAKTWWRYVLAAGALLALRSRRGVILRLAYYCGTRSNLVARAGTL